MYLLNSSYIYQRHYNIPKSESLFEYVTNNMNNSESFDSIYYVISNKNDVYHINLVGSLILEEIKYGKSIDEIIEQLLKIYNISYKKLKEDILNFINYLEEINVIKNE